MCVIDSRNAGDCTVRSLIAGPPSGMSAHLGTYGQSEEDMRDCLLVRVRDCAEPWAGCYALVYAAAARRLELVRYDPAERDSTQRYDGPPPGAKLLAQAEVPGSPVGRFMWFMARGSALSGGIGQAQLVSATDATYPRGYVGFGARPDAFAAFSRVEMRGGPGTP